MGMDLTKADELAGSVRVRSRLRTWVELLVAYGLILAVIWTPRPWQRVLYWAPVVWISVTTWLSFESWRAMGWRVTNLLRSMWVVAIAAVLGGVAVLLALHLGTLHAPAGPLMLFRTFYGYAIWSFVQQFLMLDYFFGRFLRVLRTTSYAVLASSLIFALAHLPNPILTPATLLWGLAACLIFLRYGNLWPLGMAHAIFGICLAVTVPARLTHNMRVGIGYWGFHPHHHRRNSDHSVSTPAWVSAEAPTRRS